MEAQFIQLSKGHRARIEHCLSGEKPDRVPVALWRHFPVDDQSPQSLAAATIAFQRAYDFDFVKVTPASSFCLKDWGVQDEWRGATEGTREYTGRVIDQPEDWTRLRVLDPQLGQLGAQLDCLRRITHELGADVPVIQTIFNPLSQAKNLAGKGKLAVHLHRYPDAVQAGLQVITQSIQNFIEAAKKTGIAGVFYAVQHAQYSLMTEAMYELFGTVYDLQALAPAKELWLNVLHLHGEDVMFDKLADYPVQVLNWHDRETEPDLQGGQARFSGVVCGGLQRERTLTLGTPEQVRAQALDAIRATNGRRFILGTGCVTPTIAPRANIVAARKAVEIAG